METSNTGQNRKPGTFVKGDARINRKGRPKSFDQLRALAQMIAHEAALEGDRPQTVNGKPVSVAEAIMRKWAASRDTTLQTKFIEIAFGKVPDRMEHTGADGDTIEIKLVND